MANFKILVVGDVVADERYDIKCDRVDQTTPIPVYQISTTPNDVRYGGAALIARQLGKYGADVDLVCFERLKYAPGEGVSVAISHRRPPRIRRRYYSRDGALLARHDITPREYHALPATALGELRHEVEYLLGAYAYDAIVLADYGGDAVGAAAVAFRGVTTPIYIDPHSKGDFHRYPPSTAIFPNSDEAAVMQLRLGVEDTETLAYQLNTERLIITSPRGAITSDGQSVLTRQRQVCDSVGAGDVLTASYVMAELFGLEPKTALEFASAAATAACDNVGPCPISLFDAWGEYIAGDIQRKILSPKLSLTFGPQLAKVFPTTNGVFDLMHVGHIALLTEARNRYMSPAFVLVNDDASARENKGYSRPIIPLQQRMFSLAALESVAAVTSFSSRTAQQILRQLKPRLYFKGPGYTPTGIPEGSTVAACGGDFCSIAPKPPVSCSTTELVARIKEIDL